MLSPDGKYAVIRVDHQEVAGNATILEWRVVRLSDGETWTIADGGAPRWNLNGYIAPETPQWSPDGSWIYFRKVRNEEIQLWRVSRDGRRQEQITHDPADVQAFIITADGRVHYAVGPATRSEVMAAEQVERDSGVLLDSNIIVGFPIAGSFPVNGRMATFRLDKASVTGRSTLLGSLPLKVFTLDAGLRNPRPADPALEKRFGDFWRESYGGLGISDPGRAGRAKHAKTGRVATVEPAGDASGAAGSRSGRLLRSRGPDGAAHTCTDTRCTDADHLDIVGWSGEELIFQTRTFETVRLNAWDVGAGKLRTVLTTEGVLGSSESGIWGECQLAGATAVCIAAAADLPPRLVSIDLKTGARRELLDPNPDLTSDRLGVARKVTLHDRYGNATVGWVVLPGREAPAATSKRLPLVITSYSCRGFLLGGSGRDVPEHVLAGLGYASVCIDGGGDVVRRAEGFVHTQENGNRSFLDYFEGAVRALDAEEIVDRKRVLLTGFSGSSTATAFAISQSDMFTAAAVMTGGSIDPIVCHLAAHYRSCVNLAKEAGLPLPFDYRSGVLADSPALNVEKIRTPLLMQLPEVEYAGMMQLYAAMLDYGRAMEMYIFPEAYHYKNQPRQRLAVYQRNVDWAEFWLRGIESSDAKFADRNARWEEMRASQCRLFDAEPAGGRPWYCM
jgi:dipeptidyl aminopeptidase/acylaminoacyl peptidase